MCQLLRSLCRVRFFNAFAIFSTHTFLRSTDIFVKRVNRLFVISVEKNGELENAFAFGFPPGVCVLTQFFEIISLWP